MDNVFRMSWNDFKHAQFMFNGVVHKLGTHKQVVYAPIRAKILFVLNIHRGRWLTSGDLIDFVYGDDDPDDWGDWQLGGVKTAICSIRKILPKNIEIISQKYFGYKLIMKGEEY